MIHAHDGKMNEWRNAQTEVCHCALRNRVSLLKESRLGTPVSICFCSCSVLGHTWVEKSMKFSNAVCRLGPITICNKNITWHYNVCTKLSISWDSYFSFIIIWIGLIKFCRTWCKQVRVLFAKGSYSSSTSPPVCTLFHIIEVHYRAQKKSEFFTSF